MKKHNFNPAPTFPRMIPKHYEFAQIELVPELQALDTSEVHRVTKVSTKHTWVKKGVRICVAILFFMVITILMTTHAQAF